MGFQALKSSMHASRHKNQGASMHKPFLQIYSIKLKTFTQCKDKKQIKRINRHDRNIWPRWNKWDQIYPFT